MGWGCGAGVGSGRKVALLRFRQRKTVSASISLGRMFPSGPAPPGRRTSSRAPRRRSSREPPTRGRRPAATARWVATSSSASSRPRFEVVAIRRTRSMGRSETKTRCPGASAAPRRRRASRACLGRSSRRSRRRACLRDWRATPPPWSIAGQLAAGHDEGLRGRLPGRRRAPARLEHGRGCRRTGRRRAPRSRRRARSSRSPLEDPEGRGACRDGDHEAAMRKSREPTSGVRPRDT
jgi:hypothetical protein